MQDLTKWKGCLPPQRRVMEGRFVRLEPLDAAKHGDEIYAFSSGEGAAERMRYMFQRPQSRENFQTWLEHAASQKHPIYFAMIDKESGKVGGRLGFMHFDPAHGVVEFGGVLWGPLISRRPAATEAVFLCASHVFDELGYRRLEWTSQYENTASNKAALRFGFSFEGTMRQYYVVRGLNRNVNVLSMLDKEWASLKLSYEKWLDPSNFDENGIQRKKLEDFRMAS